jgi:hypothetical protein
VIRSSPTEQGSIGIDSVIPVAETKPSKPSMQLLNQTVVASMMPMPGLEFFAKLKEIRSR